MAKKLKAKTITQEPHRFEVRYLSTNRQMRVGGLGSRIDLILKNCNERGEFTESNDPNIFVPARVTKVHYDGYSRDTYHKETGNRVILTFEEYKRLGKPLVVLEHRTYESPE